MCTDEPLDAVDFLNQSKEARLAHTYGEEDPVSSRGEALPSASDRLSPGPRIRLEELEKEVGDMVEEEQEQETPYISIERDFRSYGKGRDD